MDADDGVAPSGGNANDNDGVFSAPSPVEEEEEDPGMTAL